MVKRSDDEIFGDDDFSLPTPAESSARSSWKSNRRIMKKSKDHTLPDPEASVDDCSDGAMQACHLCQKVISSAPREFLQYDFHAACYLANRCWRRLHLTHGDAKAKQLDMMLQNDVQRWRAQVLPLVVRGDKRDSKARADLRRSITQKEKFQQYHKEESKTIMSKRHFKSHKGFWDKMESSDASEEFEELLRAQGGKYNDGEPKVAIDTHTKIISMQGTTRRTIETEGASSSAPLASLASTTASEPDRHDSRRQRTERKDRRRRSVQDSQRKRPRRSSGDTMSDSGASAKDDDDDHHHHHDDHDGGDDDDDARSSAPPATPRLRRHIDKQAKRARAPAPSPPQRSAASERSHSVAGATPRSEQKKSALFYIHEKDAMSKRTLDLITQYTQSRGVMKRLEMLIPKMTQEQVETLNINPKVILQQLVSAIDDLKSVSLDIDTVKAQNWDDTVAAISTKISAVELAAEAAEEAHAAVKFLVEKNVKKKKAADNSVRYKRLRLANKMTMRGYGPLAAKHLAGELEVMLCARDKQAQVKCDPDDESFDAASITLWTNASAGPSNSFADAINEGMKDRIGSLQECLSDRPRWGGAMVRHDINPEKIKLITVLKKMTADWSSKGAYPWVAAVRALHWRHGPGSWPMTGFASLVRGEVDGKGAHCLLWCLPAESILSKGIALPDLHSFLETPSGQAVAESVGKVINLKANQTLWVPFGFICIPVVTKLEDKDADPNDAECKDGKDGKDKDGKDTKDKGDANVIGAFTVLTVFDDALKDSVPERVWEAIHSYNHDYLTKNGHKTAWGSRKQLFDTLKSPVT